MHRIVIFAVILAIVGCVAGEKVTSIDPGMTKDEVFEVMGRPDSFRQRGEYTIYKYTNRLISGWSWDRSDYSFIFDKEGKLIEYGSGEVRERNVGGIHSVFIYQM